MDINQIVIAIYSYLFHQDSRLEADYRQASDFSSGRHITSNQIFRTYLAKLKYEHFREFSRAISDILNYYEP